MMKDHLMCRYLPYKPAKAEMKEETHKDWIIQWVEAFTLCIEFVDADVRRGGKIHAD